MPSLYELGFRQGMRIEVSLDVPTAVWDGADLLWETVSGNAWVVVTQDCDLLGMSEDSTGQVELRRAEPALGGEPSGIRSQFFVLPDGERLDGKGLRPLFPANYIATLPLGRSLPSERLRALKLWLGRRYDRPAVPEHLVALMKGISAALVKGAARRKAMASTRDVFVEIDDVPSPPKYKLTAVCEGGTHKAVEQVLVDAALDLPEALGTLVDAAVVTSSGASIALMEGGYVADLSDESIRRGGITGAPPI